MEKRAKQFYDRAVSSERYESRLLCFFDAFCAQFGTEGMKKASQVCALAEDDFKKAVDCCYEDHEGPSVRLTQAQLEALRAFLEKI